ncbi:hypothetical protein HMPREF1548_00424 [Clostridium sp. KLE 1755]|nr:hypothetical protein HMPREF1548_00424 [Clostridium sp. KLE 1755]
MSYRGEHSFFDFNRIDDTPYVTFCTKNPSSLKLLWKFQGKSFIIE